MRSLGITLFSIVLFLPVFPIHLAAADRMVVAEMFSNTD